MSFLTAGPMAKNTAVAVSLPEEEVTTQAAVSNRTTSVDVRLWNLPIDIASRLDAFEHLSFASLHPERQSAQDRDALRWLAPLGALGAAAWSRHRSHALRVEHKLVDKPLSSMSVDLMRVVLLDQQELPELARLCGLALLAPSIRLSVARERVAKLKQLLGERHYQFAVRDAPFRCQDVDARLIDSVESLQSSILPLGWAVLEAAVRGSDADPAVVERFALKLPPSLPVQAVEEVGKLGEEGEQVAIARKIPLQAAESLALANTLLFYLDFPWLSSFSVPR